MKKYKLCYINDHCAWFTDAFEHQWGDDWDDKPYETNAEEPYDEWSELINDNPDWTLRTFEHHQIEFKKLFFELPGYYGYLPCEHGRFSVEQINKGITPWIWTEDFKIDAGTEYEDFIRIIQENGGEVYTLLD